MNMYAIFWKYLDDSWLISESGNGNFCLTLEDATELCEILNLKYANRINHWCNMKVEDVLDDPQSNTLDDPTN